MNESSNLGAPERTVPIAGYKASRFRKRFRPLSSVELAYNDAVKDTAAKIEFLGHSLGTSRELSLCYHHLEIAVHFLIKDLTGDRRIIRNETDEAPLLAALEKLSTITAD